MVINAFRNRLIYTNLTFEEFPSSFGEVTIFFISDIHRRKVSSRLLKQIRKKVDLVIIGGDLAEEGVSMSQIRENLRVLTNIGPTYFVWGNNDYELEYHELDALLLDMNVKSLTNEAVLFESYEQEAFVLLGVDDVAKKKAELSHALQHGKELKENAFRILVSHNPSILREIKEIDKISLVLSGHTHGGQIRILGYGMYEKGGIVQRGNTTVFISNGYGTTTLPMRLGAPSEAHILTLTTSS